MPSTTVIFRTVSIEKLSSVLDLCQQQWADSRIIVISSQNRIAELECDDRVAQALPLSDQQPYFATALRALNRQVENLVIPTGNQGGAGYENIFQGLNSGLARACYLAPYCRSLQPVSYIHLRIKVGINQAATLVTYPLAALWARQMIKKLHKK